MHPRALAGASGYEMNFLGHRLLRLIYAGSLTRGHDRSPISAGVLAVNGLLLRPRAAPRTGAQAHGSRRDRTRFGPEPRKIGNDRRARPA